MAYIFRALSKKDVKKLDIDDEDEIVIISKTLTRKNFKNRNVSWAPFLVPNPVVMKIFFDNGYCKFYKEEYYSQISRPSELFFINEMIFRMAYFDTNLVLVCHEDESEYKYINLLGKFIHDRYDVEVSKKDNKYEVINNDLIERCVSISDIVTPKLIDVGIDPRGMILYSQDAKKFKDINKNIRERYIHLFR